MSRLDKMFKLSENGTTVGTELRAGLSFSILFIIRYIYVGT